MKCSPAAELLNMRRSTGHHEKPELWTKQPQRVERNAAHSTKLELNRAREPLGDVLGAAFRHREEVRQRELLEHKLSRRIGTLGGQFDKMEELASRAAALAGPDLHQQVTAESAAFAEDIYKGLEYLRRDVDSIVDPMADNIQQFEDQLRLHESSAQEALELRPFTKASNTFVAMWIRLSTPWPTISSNSRMN